MIINSINLNHLRIFESVYRTKSMTDSARDLHLTQSGVSQHIKSFEESLGIKLFDRINQLIVPTNQANALYQACKSSLLSIENALSELVSKSGELEGTIRVGMPIEFGNNVVIPFLATFHRKYPKVKFRLRLEFASTMNQLLLSGELDFGFIDDFKMDSRIVTQDVYPEVLDLYAHPDLLKKKGQPKNDRKYFESLEFVDYQEDEAILRMWLNHHLKKKNLNIQTVATVMDVQGMARLVREGVGVGILPGHLAQKLILEGYKLYKFKGSGTPLTNTIRVAWLEGRTLSPQAVILKNELVASLKNKK